MFDIAVKFILEIHSCEKCSNHKSEEWQYYFCNTDCLMRWLREKEIEKEGFPCKDCRNREGASTGWQWGFEVNGTCKTCDGKKRVKGHRKQQWEHNQEAAAREALNSLIGGKVADNRNDVEI
jgi:hypothetical protein